MNIATAGSDQVLSRSRTGSLTLLMLLGLAAITPGAGATTNLPTAGLTMHMDAAVGVEVVDRSVLHWWDQSGFKQNLHAVGSPVLRANGLNGRAVIELDSAEDSLQQTVASSLPKNNDDRTLIVLSATSNANVRLGYGSFECGGFFALQQDRNGYSDLSRGCTENRLPGPRRTEALTWHLNTLIVQSGQLYHLLDGKVIDGRSNGLQTASGPFRVVSDNFDRAGGIVRIATVLAYNWALDQDNLQAIHRHLGAKWFNSPTYFGTPPNLPDVEFPNPQVTLSHEKSANQGLQLNWRVRFADECQAVANWTQMATNAGTELINNPHTGARYGINCWHNRGSTTQYFELDTSPVEISWQLPKGHENLTTGYRLFLGKQPKNYNQILRLTTNSTNSHTLNLAPGTYYLAMSTIGSLGQESSLSGELQITVR